MTDDTQEIDVILEDFYDGDIRQSDMGKAKQAIADWHNRQVKNAVATAEDNLDQYWNKELDKQIEAVLDRLIDSERMYWDGSRDNYLVRKSAIEQVRKEWSNAQEKTKENTL